MQKAAVFDVGRVLYNWNLRHLFEKLIADPEELDWFLSNVITEGWHFQHDRGEALDVMVPARIAEFPQYEALILAYRSRFNETIPGPVKGTHALVERLAAKGAPLYCLTNFGEEFWEGFRPSKPIFDRFVDIVVSGTEQVAKPDPRIYEITEERTGRTGAQLFFTDDSAANVEAARARGWDAHLFTDAAALEKQLIASGLL
ncbi:HAD-IA family hydrolase [Erythrobacter sp. F6033]|uniref:HAD-IA family hydrolase n=1 Tax=Erythrobacter sp. F6033 TaxID=2926401 RepID=UPI001FF25678|nr:HAD-IA family hydrolase [Erythrobacter sp. F6033]MCK0127229.1 HAD-IA family hydrolase [Erythrobacter sp. F6033]